MTIKNHKHAVASTTVRPYSGDTVNRRRPNAYASGGHVDVDMCTCGHVRKTNVNMLHVERGPWLMGDA